MTIDHASLKASRLSPSEYRWTRDDVILYHLGLGAGVPPTDPTELRYTYEVGLEVLPTFVVLAPAAAVAAILDLPGFADTRSQSLHGEQEVILHRPLPDAGTAISTARVVGVYDKGSGALAVIETESTDEAGDLLFVNRFSLFFRGEGGFGGERGPASPLRTPNTTPDHVARIPTLQQQALLYRLSGDKTAMHADPEASAKAGFPRPILHGLCTYGMAAKAVVDHAASGEPHRLRRFLGRFSGVVFPGDTLLASIWNDGAQADVSVATEAGLPVLQAKAWLNG